MLKKYENDDWLGKNGVRTVSDGVEWPVAYHGTKEMNILPILAEGFSLEKSNRFLYGRGIYCTPHPQVALDYAEVFTFKVPYILVFFAILKFETNRFTDLENILSTIEKSQIKLNQQGFIDALIFFCKLEIGKWKWNGYAYFYLFI